MSLSDWAQKLLTVHIQGVPRVPGVSDRQKTFDSDGYQQAIRNTGDQPPVFPVFLDTKTGTPDTPSAAPGVPAGHLLNQLKPNEKTTDRTPEHQEHPLFNKFDKPAGSSSFRHATRPKKQISCQAYEFNGILMSTATEHCLDRQGSYCKGCPLYYQNKEEGCAASGTYRSGNNARNYDDPDKRQAQLAVVTALRNEFSFSEGDA